MVSIKNTTSMHEVHLHMYIICLCIKM